MSRYILFFCLLLSHSVSKSQSYLDSLYGNSNIEGARGAYELEDSTLVFVYTRVSGKDHIRISRIKPNGELIYDKGQSDTASSRRVLDFVHAPNGNFVACGHYLAADTFSFYLVQFSPTGDEIWSKIYRTQDRIAECATLYPLYDGYLLAGQQIIYNPDPIPGHALVIRTDSTGQELWRKTYGITNWQEVIKSIAPTPDGGFLMAGYAIYPFGSFIEFQGLLIKTDSLGNEQWMQRYGQGNIGEVFLDIQPAIDGNYLVSAELNYTPGSNNIVGGLWLLKFDVEGNIIWERKYRDHGPYTWAEDFVELPDGSVVAAGATRNIPTQSQSGFLIKISAEGDSLWSHIYDRNPGYIDLFYSISATMDGGFVMSGFAQRPNGSSQDVWILKVDSLGCAVPGCFAVDVEEPVLVAGKLEVWPNPFDALLRVRLPGPPGSALARLRLYALSGQLLWEQALPTGAIETQADLGILPSGVYFLRYEREGAPPVGAKVVKIR